jgi:hypothetical protein
MTTKKIVPLRPRQKEGRQAAPTPITLADVTITWGPADRRHHITGRTLAKLIARCASKEYALAGHDAQCGTLRVGPMLRGLGGWMFPDAGTPCPELESDMRFFVTEYLSDVAAEVESEGVDSDRHAEIYTIRMGSLPAEVKK